MELDNTKKLVMVFVSIITIYVVLTVVLIILNPDVWYWLISSLTIGLILVATPLLRALKRSLLQNRVLEEKPMLTFHYKNSHENSNPKEEQITCFHCGYELPSGNIYCDNCGQKVKK